MILSFIDQILPDFFFGNWPWLKVVVGSPFVWSADADILRKMLNFGFGFDKQSLRLRLTSVESCWAESVRWGQPNCCSWIWEMGKVREYWLLSHKDRKPVSSIQTLDMLWTVQLSCNLVADENLGMEWALDGWSWAPFQMSLACRWDFSGTRPHSLRSGA